MKTIETEKHEYFCIHCSKIEEVEMPKQWEPSPFIKGKKCESCGKKQWAYSPPATPKKW